MLNDPTLDEPLEEVRSFAGLMFSLILDKPFLVSGVNLGVNLGVNWKSSSRVNFAHTPSTGQQPCKRAACSS